MNRFYMCLAATALFLAGCGPQAAEDPKTPAYETQPATGEVNFDTLLDADKFTMTTKAGSDLPKNWTFKGDEAKAKVKGLVPVLKEGKELSAEEGRLVKRTVPMVIFIFDVGSEKKNINVYEDRFEYMGKWFLMDNAPDRTYGSVNQLEK